jgi:hypothetical protein
MKRSYSCICALSPVHTPAVSSRADDTSVLAHSVPVRETEFAKCISVAYKRQILQDFSPWLAVAIVIVPSAFEPIAWGEVCPREAKTKSRNTNV